MAQASPDWGANRVQQLYPGLYPVAEATSGQSRGERRRRGRTRGQATPEQEASDGGRHHLLEELRRGGPLGPLRLDEVLASLPQLARDKLGHRAILEKLE